MKKLLLLLAIFQTTGIFAQSDNCTGVIPSLTVGTTCTATAYSIPTTFFDNFSSEPSCGWDDVDGFFQFTATSTYTNVTITDATPAGPNPGLMVVSGTCGGTLTSLGCSQTTLTNGNNESVSFGTVIGQVYMVVIFATNANNTGAPSQATNGTICVTQSTFTGPIVASECANYVNICSNAGFQIDPNGYGAINEIPASGSLGNPEYDPFWGPLSPWGGGNMGCLQSGENNSTGWLLTFTRLETLHFHSAQEVHKPGITTGSCIRIPDQVLALPFPVTPLHLSDVTGTKSIMVELA